MCIRPSFFRLTAEVWASTISLHSKLVFALYSIVTSYSPSPSDHFYTTHLFLSSLVVVLGGGELMLEAGILGVALAGCVALSGDALYGTLSRWSPIFKSKLFCNEESS